MSDPVRSLVVEQVARLAGRAVADRDALIDDLGLKSLQLAQLVATLEIALDVQPFVERFAVTDLRTVGDVVRAFAAMQPEGR